MAKQIRDAEDNYCKYCGMVGPTHADKRCVPAGKNAKARYCSTCGITKRWARAGGQCSCSPAGQADGLEDADMQVALGALGELPASVGTLSGDGPGGAHSYRKSEFPKVCTNCNKVYTLEAWSKLTSIGRTWIPADDIGPGYFVVMANCQCGGTMAVEAFPAGGNVPIEGLAADPEDVKERFKYLAPKAEDIRVPEWAGRRGHDLIEVRPDGSDEAIVMISFPSTEAEGFTRGALAASALKIGRYLFIPPGNGYAGHTGLMAEAYGIPLNRVYGLLDVPGAHPGGVPESLLTDILMTDGNDWRRQVMVYAKSTAWIPNQETREALARALDESERGTSGLSDPVLILGGDAPMPKGQRPLGRDVSNFTLAEALPPGSIITYAFFDQQPNLSFYRAPGMRAIRSPNPDYWARQWVDEVDRRTVGHPASEVEAEVYDDLAAFKAEDGNPLIWGWGDFVKAAALQEELGQGGAGAARPGSRVTEKHRIVAEAMFKLFYENVKPVAVMLDPSDPEGVLIYFGDSAEQGSVIVPFPWEQAASMLITPMEAQDFPENVTTAGIQQMVESDEDLQEVPQDVDWDTFVGVISKRWNAAPAPEIGGLGASVGDEWDSPQGRREITGQYERNGEAYFSVVTNGTSLPEQIAAKHIDRVRFVEESNARSRAARDAEIAAKVAAKAAAKAADEDVHGFATGLTPVQKGRLLAALTRPMGVNGEVATRKFHIERMIAAGWKVESSERGRRLVSPDGNFFTEKDFTKIALDYAEYLSKIPAAECSAEHPEAPEVEGLGGGSGKIRPIYDLTTTDPEYPNREPETRVLCEDCLPALTDFATVRKKKRISGGHCDRCGEAFTSPARRQRARKVS